MQKDSIAEIANHLSEEDDRMAQLLRDGVVTAPVASVPIDLLREPLPSNRQGLLSAFLRERQESR
jgi:hypothetical protein